MRDPKQHDEKGRPVREYWLDIGRTWAREQGIELELEQAWTLRALLFDAYQDGQDGDVAPNHCYGCGMPHDVADYLVEKAPTLLNALRGIANGDTYKLSIKHKGAPKRATKKPAKQPRKR